MQIRSDGGGTTFLGTVDDAIENFGGVSGDGKQSDAIDHDDVKSEDWRDTLDDGVSNTVSTHHESEVFNGAPGDHP